MKPRISVGEALGLVPFSLRAREAWLAVRGDANVPATRFGLSSVKIFHPALSVSTWLGRKRVDGLVPIINLVNRTPTPLAEGWSVRKTQVRDFRGGTLGYDSHNGTDFAVPVGTTVVTAAPGRVLRISSEYNRGGLKIFIDHGQGLVTTYNHLARALVSVGDDVVRGQPIALSGYSGIDALVAFPWSAPHVHFNVWLNGAYTDPFAVPGEVPLWRDENEPRPGKDDGEPATLTDWDPGAVEETIAACKDEAIRAELLREPDLARRAMNVLFARNYYPTRFASAPLLSVEPKTRAPWLDLPFSADESSGVMFADDA
ncbi:MAG: M23 family metallopeptidase [Polyangiaceae bacterium]